jgi:hypothetical protein
MRDGPPSLGQYDDPETGLYYNYADALGLAATMTTDNHIAIKYERVRDWTIFKDDEEISPDIRVVSLEVRSTHEQSITSAVAVTADVLFGHHSPPISLIQLIVIGPIVPATHKVAAYNANKLRLWGALERDGIDLPDGDRSEFPIGDLDNEVRYAGQIDLTPTADSLNQALEFTRSRMAVCIGRVEDAPPFPATELLTGHLQPHDNQESLLRLCLHHLSAGQTVIRSFGSFDDHTVGTDVFADGKSASLRRQSLRQPR